MNAPLPDTSSAPTRFSRKRAVKTPYLNILLIGFSLMLFVVAGCSTPTATSSTALNADQTAHDKALLNRLITELKHSPRSFIYLRSKGFTQSDEEFEQIIASNDEVFRPVRIIRRDENGDRQIPGWPGIALTQEYKESTYVEQ